MVVVTGRIGGDGNSRRQQSPEFPLVNLGILTASFISIAVGDSHQILDQLGLGALVWVR
jgi:hypothetical protein